MVRHKAQNVAARPRTRDIHISEDTDFKSMLLPQPILEGLNKTGYIKPSPIQQKALPLVRCGLDLIVQAKAGTGKTCVFTVAVLELVKPNLPHLQAVVLAPTREIALQITTVIRAIGQCVQGLKTECFIGGYPLSVDVEKVKGCHVAVAAPGRLRHLLAKGLLNPHHVRLFVLDEADKLMEKAFVKAINAIFEQMPDSKQVLACSATYTAELVEFLNQYMNDGQFVSPHHNVDPTVLLGVRQFVSVVHRHVDRLAQLKLKEKQLLHLLRSISFDQCLIFSNLHTRAVSLCNLLRGEGWGVEWIAGRQNQNDRVAALTQLRDQRVRVLITTDLTARGIDLENVNLVINLDLPMDHYTYMHRMGRSGRYGSHGMVITMVSDGQELTAFQKLIGRIGKTTQSVNRVPSNLKNIDLWTMSDDKFEQIYGIDKNEKNASLYEKSEGNTANTSKKYSPESSDSEDYVKMFSPESSDSEDYVKEYKGESTAEKFSPEDSDSEDYVKQCKEENCVKQLYGGVDFAGKVSATCVGSKGNSGKYGDIFADNIAVTTKKGNDSTSTDEKFSRYSSESGGSLDTCDNEGSVTSEFSCVCNLFVPDASDVKVVAGPSLFALKKEKHWREVLPVVVNVLKVPLNTPIALLDSKLIRVRFWGKNQRTVRSEDINDYSCKEVINFDTKRQNKDFLSFQDIEFILENGVKDKLESVCENSDNKFLSYENIEEALENGFFNMDGRCIVKTNYIEQVLSKYNVIKQRSESALINFDSFDLVGWLAVDELHNIVEEIKIDNFEVFKFDLVTCLAGKKHIEVSSPSKGMTNEANDYKDQITTFNVEKFYLSTPFSLLNIAQQMVQVTSETSGELYKDKPSLNLKPNNCRVAEPTNKEIYFSDLNAAGEYSNTETNSVGQLKKPSEVPSIYSNNKKRISREDFEYDPVNEKKKCNSLKTKNVVPSTSKRHNQIKHSYTGSISNAKRKNERKVLPDNSNMSHNGQVSTYEKKATHDGEHILCEGLEGTCAGKQHKQESSDRSGDSSSHIDMTRKLLKIGQVSHKAKPKNSESKSIDKNKQSNGFEQTRKHRNSDDSYDSFDTVEYETTDLDKTRYKLCNENGIQRKHHLIKHQDTTNDSLKESYDSHECHNTKLAKPKMMCPKHERSKSHEYRNKHVCQNMHPSMESERAKPHSKTLPRVLSNKEQKSKNKFHAEVRHKKLHKDRQESLNESYENYNSIESEISKLRELNLKMHKQDSTKRRHHHELGSRIADSESEDDESFGSGGTNRHSFMTACSQHASEDFDYLYGLCGDNYGISDGSSSVTSYTFENHFEVPPRKHQRQPRTYKYSDREHFDHNSFQRREEHDGTFPQEQEFSQNVYGHDPYETRHRHQFESYQNSCPDHQDFTDPPRRDSTHTVSGENLHQEWYTNWYLQVRQKAMELAMMEYTNTMSIP